MRKPLPVFTLIFTPCFISLDFMFWFQNLQISPPLKLAHYIKLFQFTKKGKAKTSIFVSVLFENIYLPHEGSMKISIWP